MRRGRVMPADPEEIVRIGSEAEFRPRHGAFEVEITEELREALYLEQVRLIAVDHPEGAEAHSTDKLRSPPFPPSEVWSLRNPKWAVSIAGDDGLDRTEAARALDGVFAPPGPLLPPPLRGVTRSLALTMDFGELDVTQPLVLALTGWLQYGDASVNIAASQNRGVIIIPPKLQVETAPDVWRPIDVEVGMPAGKTKTILCDLSGKLPPGSRRLRLTTTFEIRWERIALFERGSSSEVHQHWLAPDSARLRWRGFSEIASRAPGHPPIPDYERVVDHPPWRTTPEGWCTRYGEVMELLQERDGRLVILNGGDALHVRFDARNLPPVPPGYQRVFFFYAAGWDKDGDHNVVDGATIEPLPVRGPPGWELEYNTRWVPGNLSF